jgi:hypothetical protein
MRVRPPEIDEVRRHVGTAELRQQPDVGVGDVDVGGLDVGTEDAAVEEQVALLVIEQQLDLEVVRHRDVEGEADRRAAVELEVGAERTVGLGVEALRRSGRRSAA